MIDTQRHNYMVVVRSTEKDTAQGFWFVDSSLDTIDQTRKVIRDQAMEHLGAEPTLTLNNGWTLDTIPAGAVLTQSARMGRFTVAKSKDGKRVLEIVNLNVDRRQATGYDYQKRIGYR